MKKFLDAKSDDCRFPVEYSKICGEKALPKSPYCKFHHSISYVDSVKRRELFSTF